MEELAATSRSTCCRCRLRSSEVLFLVTMLSAGAWPSLPCHKEQNPPTVMKSATALSAARSTARESSRQSQPLKGTQIHIHGCEEAATSIHLLPVVVALSTKLSSSCHQPTCRSPSTNHQSPNPSERSLELILTSALRHPQRSLVTSWTLMASKT